MKPIELSVNEAPHDITVSPDGEAVFLFYTHARTRALFEQLIDLYGYADRTRVDAEAIPKLNALKRDCEWVIEQINNLKEKAND